MENGAAVSLPLAERLPDVKQTDHHRASIRVVPACEDLRQALGKTDRSSSAEFDGAVLDGSMRTKSRVRPRSCLGVPGLHGAFVAPPRREFVCRCRKLSPKYLFHFGEGQSNDLSTLAQQPLMQWFVDRFSEAHGLTAGKAEMDVCPRASLCRASARWRS